MLNSDKNSPQSAPADRAVQVLLSGGLDSATCIAYYLAHGHSVSAIFFDYGQPDTSKENAAAVAIASHYKVPLQQITLSGLKVTNGYVRARNSALLCLALLSFHQAKGLIAIGIHSGTEYIDSSEEFVCTMQRIFDLYENGLVRIDAPFLHWTKNDIWNYAQIVGLPLELTHSTAKPC
jgi:7-cyano-7-deazaguanine synthase